MPRYTFMSLLAGLHIVDTPLFYTPPVGRAINITLTYNQREADQPTTFNYSNVGQKWTFNWLSYIQDDPTSPGINVLRYVGGGGGRTYAGFNASTGAFTPESSSGAVLVQTSSSPVAYELRFSDGSKDVFSQPDGANTYPRRVFLTSQVDAYGNTVSLNYDGQLRLTALVDAIGQQTTFAYGNTGNPLLITAVTDPAGRSTQLAYDSAGRLASITDAIGMVSSFTYESASSTFVSALTTPYGTTHFAHTEGVGDPSELSIQATDPNGNTERTEYIHGAPGIAMSESQAPNMQVLNAGLNDRNSYYWDKNAFASACTITNGVTQCDYTKARIKHFLRLAPDDTLASRVVESTKAPNESRVWYSYPGSNPGETGSLDQPSQVGRVLDDGTTQLTQYTYNAQGNRTQVIDPAGRETDYDYAANGMDLIKVRQKTASGFDVLGQWTYNSQHLPLTATDAAGQTTTYIYNAAGQVTSITDPLNQTTTFNYNTSGYLTSIVNALGNTQASFTYDAIGRVATQTDSEGYVRSYSYDALNRVTSIGYPDSTNETFVYDKLDLVGHADRLGRSTVYTYDAARRLTSVTDPLNLTMSYGYFQNGQLKSLTDAKGNVTQWTRDLGNRVTSKVYPDGTTWSYTYDGAGRPKSRTDALNQTRQTSYSVDDRITGISYLNSVNATPNVSFAQDTYYPRIASMTDGSGATQYSYVPAGSLGANQLATETAPGSNTQIQYAYDALGRLSQRTVDSTVEAFNYDGLSRLTGTSNALGAFGYSYLGQTGQLTIQLLTGSPLRTDWGYQNNAQDRRLQSIAHHGAAADQTYASSVETGITQRTDSTGVTQNYTYDANNRLTGVALTGSLTASLGYDIDAANNLVGVGEGAYGYTFSGTVNNNNQITTATFVGANQTYQTDANGNVREDAYRTYQWDAENRLISITQKANNATSQFSYDGQSRRVKQVETSGTPSTSVESRFLWCGEQLCQQRDATDAVTAHYYSQGEQHLGTTPQSLYYAQDHLGSVIGTTDSAGNVLGSAEYTPYGRTKAQSGAQTTFGYAGMQQHAATGLYLTHYRVYDPQTGRWLSRDPSEEEGGLNLYGYVDGNPVGFVDPNGEAATVPYFTTGAMGGAETAGTAATVTEGAGVTIGATSTAAVGFAALAGWGAGTWINSKIENNFGSPGAALYDLLHMSGSQVDHPEARAEWEAYKTAYRQPPPPDLDDCAMLKWKLAKEKALLGARQAWDAKWSPGRHGQAILQSLNAIRNLEQRIKKAGCKCP